MQLYEYFIFVVIPILFLKFIIKISIKQISLEELCTDLEFRWDPLNF